MHIILAAHHNSCTQDLRTKLALLSLSRRRFLRLQLVYKIVHNGNCRDQLKNYLVKRSQLHNRPYRRVATLLDLGDTMSSAMGRSWFKFATVKDWSDLPKELRELSTISSFKTKVLSVSRN